ncbi:Hydroxycinnamoyl-Coenzyme A shikimate/quinate hydroxycinnamoyltransferase [Fusarium austroafricanum]|uniref:Hydroxycinnamoyl-Coenzyme A shikimate/quinate hydroxycinnamoyltransferase n=1 Tax=Fusarium austroafricanum TaxID=2364996 RepID=A0A8H4KE36_9HYPO|nr:Hydroxycinnamoyl-Coenzyme A shikimate/quinate hydroxycinnamoyltransferase [Fusarium austroafricanum]
MATIDISILESERLVTPTEYNRASPLSLLDCTTANFSDASAIWLFQKPTLDNLNLRYHMRESLAQTLQFYLQFSGHLKAVESTDGTVPPEASWFPPAERRFGRLYVHHGTEDDPGVEFVFAKSSATLESLYPSDRLSKQPFWQCESSVFQKFMAPVPIADPLKHRVKDKNGKLYPLLAVQVTELACGGFVLALKAAHPLADATTFIAFLKHWARVSSSALDGKSRPHSVPVFAPAILDNAAAGDINADEPDQNIIQKARDLPMHRYDWWAPGSTPPWPFKIPSPFDKQDLEPAGEPMPWAEWDIASPVSNYVIHLSQQQVLSLWNKANEDSSQKLSQHDAILAHIWSCIARARGLENDNDLIHCDLVYGVRSSFNLSEESVGSPIVMMNIELPASEVASPSNSTKVATQVRNTLKKIADRSNLAAHLHSVAYERSPQRIWQAFLGRRHILVTTWARAGIYDIDFGFGSTCTYAEGVVPEMDGNVLIKEAPGPPVKYWTDNGVDISVHIKTEDMERLIEDPLLYPLEFKC